MGLSYNAVMKSTSCLLLGLSLALFLPTETFGQKPWDVEQIFFGTNETEVRFVNEKGNTVTTFSRNYIRKILNVWDGIQRISSYRAVLKFATGSAPNAFARKAGGERIVVVNFAMIKLLGTDFDAWAGLLGHEIAHLKLNHQREALKRKIPLKIVDWLVDRSDPSKAVGFASSLLTSSIDMNYSRKHERESDYSGTVWAYEAGYDPMGAVRLHEALAKQNRVGMVPFLRSHPSSEERVESLTTLARELKSRE